MSIESVVADVAGVQIWKIDLDAADAAGAAAQWDTLGPAERSRAARFVFARDRRRYVAAHSALRRLLGARTGQSPHALEFHLGPFGKPYLAGPKRCSFNFSDSADVGLIALADEGEIGIDVEVLRHIPDALALSRGNFTPAEHAVLSAVHGAERDERFLWGWTRKEACLKAIGSGLSIPADTFEVGLETGSRELVVFTEGGSVSVRLSSFRSGSDLLVSLARLC